MLLIIVLLPLVLKSQTHAVNSCRLVYCAPYDTGFCAELLLTQDHFLTDA